MLAKLVNLSLIGLFPLAWTAPLARAEVTWLFTEKEVSVFSGIAELYEKDVFLAVVVFAFAVVTPYAKTLALVFVQFSDSRLAERMMPALELLGKLSMTDVFLVAFYVILYRGVADVQIAWGLYLFTGLVLASIWAGWSTRRTLKRAARV